MTDHENDPEHADASPEWYTDGLRFKCTQCGNCCTGPPGYVWFNEAEGRAMAKAMGETEASFLKTHAKQVRGKWTLREIRTEHGMDCVLLDRESVPGKALCSVYQARPAQCGGWPFWPENLASRQAWEDVKRTTPCPGMNEGPLIPVSQIRIIRDASTSEV